MSHREDKGKGRSYHTNLYISIPPTCLPIVYHPDYNITFMGLEKLHPFDAGKWGKVINFLKEEQFVTDGNIVEAREATEEDLLVVHTKRYLNRLKWSLTVATITEIPPLLFLPNFLVQRKVLRPLRTQTGGTIMVTQTDWTSGHSTREDRTGLQTRLRVCAVNTGCEEPMEKNYSQNETAEHSMIPQWQ